MEIREFSSGAALIEAAALAFVAEVEGRDRSKPFRVALTGGTLGIELLAELQRRSFDPTGVEVYWGDERWVGLEHPDRNEAQALDAWPMLARATLHRFQAPGDVSLEAAAAEMDTHFASVVATNGNVSFDLVLLGIGPDGHVASLFPGHALDQNKWVVFETASPKPPAERLSFSYHALNASKKVWFLAAGAAKAEVVSAAIGQGEVSGLPCSRVRGSQETVWFLDSVIAASLAR